MPERSTRLSELKEQLRDAQEISLDDTPHFSLESAPYKKVEPITISPKEQIRYKENDAFADAVYDDLHWLLAQTGKISVEEFEQRIEVVEKRLSPAQIEVFARIRDRLKSAIESATQIDQKTIDEVIQKARELRYLLPRAKPSVEITPWGAIILSVTEEEFSSPIDKSNFNKLAFKVMEVARQGIDDPRLVALLERIIVLKKTDNEEKNARVKKHELFHDVYGVAVRPEQPTLYDDAAEKRLWAQIKDEILAYLFEGRWRPDLRALCHDVRLKDRTAAKDFYGHYMDLWGFVSRSLQKEMSVDEAAEKADEFADHVWLLVRELARLYYSRAPVEDGIKAVLTAQDAKEAMYKLCQIGDRGCLDGEILWKVIRRESQTDMYKADELSAYQIENFIYYFSYYRLPLIKNHDRFLSSLEGHIQTLKSKEVVPEQKISHENNVRLLEQVRADLRERETHTNSSE